MNHEGAKAHRERSLKALPADSLRKRVQTGIGLISDCFSPMKTMLVSEAKPILGELVRKAAMGHEVRISPSSLSDLGSTIYWRAD